MKPFAMSLVVLAFFGLCQAASATPVSDAGNLPRAAGLGLAAEAGEYTARRGRARAVVVRPGRPGRPGVVRPGRPGRPGVVRPGVRPRPPVVVVRPWRQRPHYGRVLAGVVLGTIITAAVVGAPPPPPAPNLCWYWTNSFQNEGYWDYCR